ncbi:MAG: hypothetical protein K9L30_13015 [Desulfobacterales bacterium]|nr:hypothetical protein [Desulfobacterales bacterium]
MNKKLISSVLQSDIKTPAYIYDEQGILDRVSYIKELLSPTNCRLYYPLKTNSLGEMLKTLSNHVDGFSASSLFEAQLAKEIHEKVHITSPGLRRDEISDVSSVCHSISFNSLSQYEHLKDRVNPEASCGLRINTRISFVKDDRYNPCRKNSRLGTPITDILSGKAIVPDEIEGLHFHTNSEDSDFSHLKMTVDEIDRSLPDLLGRMKWLNVGGGYMFEGEIDAGPLVEAFKLLEGKYGLQVVFEPGAGVVNSEGYMVSSVLDIMEVDDLKIAILDTTVNHMEMILVYNRIPDLYGTVSGKGHTYMLGGSTCLAGDLLGTHSFEKPLQVGDKIIFLEMGAYTLVTTHHFNGVNLPSLYKYSDDEIALLKHFEYPYFRDKWV